MQRNIEQVNEFTQKVTLLWSEEEIEKLFRDKVAELKNKIQVPCFRVGKAPLSIIRARFGNIILEDIKQNILEEKLYEELDIKEDNLLGVEDVETGEIEFGKSFEVITTVEVKPEVSAKDYKALKLEKQIYKPSEDAVDEAVDNIREQFASLEEVEVPSEKDDYLVVKLGEDLKYLPLTADLDEATIDQLVGLSKGDEKDVEITFPKNYLDKTLAGKDYKGQMSVTMVKRRKLPEVDLSFMKSVFPDIEKEEDFRPKVAENIQKQSDQMTEGYLHNAAMKALVENNDIEVPKSAMRQELVRKLAYQYKIDPSKIGRDKIDEMVEETKDELRSTVLSRWLLEDIAVKESLEVGDADLDEKLREISASGGMDLEDVKKHLEESGEAEGLKQDLLVEKALKFVIDNADIQEKEINLGERESE